MSDVCLQLLRLVVCTACSSTAAYPSCLSSGPGSSVPRPAAVSAPTGDDLVLAAAAAADADDYEDTFTFTLFVCLAPS